MNKSVRVDFVSDVVCPWCAIGLGALEEAIRRVEGEISVELTFKPFELNPDMPAQGENAVNHIIEKYGASVQEIARNQVNLRTLGERVGFHFDMEKRTHFYNTFDAHRLLYWAQIKGKQRELKHALLKAYFTDGVNISELGALLDVAISVELPEEDTRRVLHSNEFAAEVRSLQGFYRSQGVHGVPTVVLNNKHRLTGSQSAAQYERVLREMALQLPVAKSA